MVKLEVLSPVAQRAGNPKFRAAPRVGDLNGKVIGIYDNGKPGGIEAQERLIEQLGHRFGEVRFNRYQGSVGGRTTLTAKDAERMAKECDVVIGIRAD